MEEASEVDERERRRTALSMVENCGEDEEERERVFES